MAARFALPLGRGISDRKRRGRSKNERAQAGSRSVSRWSALAHCAVVQPAPSWPGLSRLSTRLHGHGRVRESAPAAASYRAVLPGFAWQGSMRQSAWMAGTSPAMTCRDWSRTSPASDFLETNCLKGDMLLAKIRSPRYCARSGDRAHGADSLPLFDTAGLVDRPARPTSPSANLSIRALRH